MLRFEGLGKPALAAALLCLSGRAIAEPILSVTYANTTTKYSDVKAGSGFATSLGYQFAPVRIFVEGEYYQSGKMDYEFSPGDGVKYTGGKGFVGYGFRAGAWRFWLKGGYYSLEGKTAYGSKTDTGFTLGTGADWLFLKDFGLRIDLDTPFGVDPGPGLDSDGEHTQLSVIKIGLVWRPTFGGASGQASRDPATPAAPSAPAYASASPVAAAPVGAVGGPQVPAGAVLRQRPQPEAVPLLRFADVTTVSLQQSVSNSYGKWWFATANGVTGWILDADLLPR
jgi:hypothetical protein